MERYEFPDHEWNGTDDGHSCAKCGRGSPWICDPVAHGIGDFQRKLGMERLLDAIENPPPNDV